MGHVNARAILHEMVKRPWARLGNGFAGARCAYPSSFVAGGGNSSTRGHGLGRGSSPDGDELAYLLEESRRDGYSDLDSLEVAGRR